MMDDEDEARKNVTPKQARLAWVKSNMPKSVPVDNFNKDSNNALAIACLVEAIAPGLFPECQDLNPTYAVENAYAMQAAEDWLGVPQVRTLGFWCVNEFEY